MQDGWFGPTVVDCQLDQNVIGVRLGVFNLAVEVILVAEDTRIKQFVFAFGSRTASIDVGQVFVRKASLRVFVERLHVGMSRRGVLIVVALFDVFAVIAFWTR